MDHGFLFFFLDEKSGKEKGGDQKATKPQMDHGYYDAPVGFPNHIEF